MSKIPSQSSSTSNASADTRPMVSVVIPSHNRADLIQRAVATAVAQVGVDFEVVVIDDGSAVPVSTVIDHPLVRVLRNEQAQGVAHARNRGVAEARGTYIAFLDDDDLWAPEKLREQVAAMERTGVEWSHTGMVCLDGDLKVRWTRVADTEMSRSEAIRKSNFVGTPSCVMASKACLEAVGGFDPTFSILADWDMWISLAEQGPGCAVQQPLIGYMTHVGSMHRQGTKPIVQEYRRLQRKHAAGGKVSGASLWRWIANTRRDSGHRLSAVPIFLATAVVFRDRGSLLAGVRAVGPPPRTPDSTPADVAPEWVTRWNAAPAGDVVPAG